MGATSFSHVSDLHIGVGPRAERAAGHLCEALLREPGPVLLTGDVTNDGLPDQLDRFRDLFSPLLRSGRLIAVPGNHDRLGDDLRDFFMHGPRVQAEQRGGLYVVRLDSTAPHNRRWIDSHGLLTPRDVDEIEAALRGAPAEAQTVLMMHHHPLPLAHDHWAEQLVSLLGWPCANELELGRELLSRIRGLCDVVLHGHRHAAMERCPWPSDPRPLRVFNAGSSTFTGRFRHFRSVRKPACWISVGEPRGAALPAAA